MYNGDCKPGQREEIAVGGANVQIVHMLLPRLSRGGKSMIHSFTITFGAKYLTDMVSSVPPYESLRIEKIYSLSV